MEHEVDIAIVGATGLVGAAVLERLAESKISVATIYALASDRSQGQTVSFGSRQLEVFDLAEFDFSRVQLSLFCVPEDVSQNYLDTALAAGNYCIDFSAYSRTFADVPLVVQGINEGELETLTTRCVASPDSSVVHLAQILSVLRQAGSLQHVNVTILRAVSEFGRAGIDELSSQSIALFNLKPVRCTCFTQQIAFNILPHVSQTSVADDLPLSLQAQLRQVMQDDRVALNASLVQAPVFYGHSMQLRLEFSDEIPITVLEALIQSSSELNLAKKEAHRPNPVSDTVNQKGVFIGGLRPDASGSHAINLWATADNIHQGAAINGVQLAEILVKDYL